MNFLINILSVFKLTTAPQHDVVCLEPPLRKNEWTMEEDALLLRFGLESNMQEASEYFTYRGRVPRTKAACTRRLYLLTSQPKQRFE